MFGETLLREGRLLEAEASLRRAAELDPTDWSAQFGLGTAQYQQGRTDEALANWRTAVALDRRTSRSANRSGWSEHPERFYPRDQFRLAEGPTQVRGIRNVRQTSSAACSDLHLQVQGRIPACQQP